MTLEEKAGQMAQVSIESLSNSNATSSFSFGLVWIKDSELARFNPFSFGIHLVLEILFFFCRRIVPVSDAYSFVLFVLNTPIRSNPESPGITFNTLYCLTALGAGSA